MYCGGWPLLTVSMEIRGVIDENPLHLMCSRGRGVQGHPGNSFQSVHARHPWETLTMAV